MRRSARPEDIYARVNSQELSLFEVQEDIPGVERRPVDGDAGGRAGPLGENFVGIARTRREQAQAFPPRHPGAGRQRDPDVELREMRLNAAVMMSLSGSVWPKFPQVMKRSFVANTFVLERVSTLEFGPKA